MIWLLHTGLVPRNATLVITPAPSSGPAGQGHAPAGMLERATGQRARDCTTISLKKLTPRT
jgi:hypothetical protein